MLRRFCDASRNPLKSGQCFLRLLSPEGVEEVVATFPGRNPLKSGQCFLLGYAQICSLRSQTGRNPLKSGQCFLLKPVMGGRV